jgi:hypothetical protein
LGSSPCIDGGSDSGSFSALLVSGDSGPCVSGVLEFIVATTFEFSFFAFPDKSGRAQWAAPPLTARLGPGESSKEEVRSLHCSVTPV